MAYCSTLCRDQAWGAYHRDECGWTDILYRTNVGKHGLLAYRTLLQVKSRPDFLTAYDVTTQKEVYDSTDYATIHGLVGNSRQRTVADLFRRTVMAVYLAKIMREDGEKVAEALLRLLQSYPCNAHEISQLVQQCDQPISQAELVEIGAGAMPVLSLLNHSCDPNVVRHCFGDTIAVSTIRRIGAGEELVDNYGYHYATQDRMERRAKLRHQYYFDCACSACEQRWPLYHDIPRLPSRFRQSIADTLQADLEGFMQLSGRLDPADLKRAAGRFAHFIRLMDLDSNAIRRPVREYNDAQEALKQCLLALSI